MSIAGIETIRATGSGKYIIQKARIDETLVGSVWLVGIGRGVLVCAATLCLTPLYVHIVTEPGAAQVLYVVAFASLIRGLRSPGVRLAERDVHFRRVVFYELTVHLLTSKWVGVRHFGSQNGAEEEGM